jgi:hypothetical protein
MVLAQTAYLWVDLDNSGIKTNECNNDIAARLDDVMQEGAVHAGWKCR